MTLGHKEDPMKNPDGLAYDYVQATHDFGRSPVPKQGIVLHMAEGSRVVEYLSGGNVVRNVSATFAITTEGEVVQMLPLDHTSGSLNPRDVRTSTDPDGFWGRRFTRFYDPDVLTGRANQLTISIECAGTAAQGPNPKQVASIIELVGTLRARYKRPIGFGGHRDFADYKLCPGRSAGVKALIAELGHGREDVPVDPPVPDPCGAVRKELEVVKTKLYEAQDIIEEESRRAGRVATNLKAYVPRPNEGR